MSDNTITLHAQARDATKGTGASRRLRRIQGKIPAIVYGIGKPAQPIVMFHKDIMKATEQETFYSQVLTLQIGSNKQDVIVKALQRHPYKPLIIHADFQRVASDVAITVAVPLHFLNAESCIGVKQEGGAVMHIENTVEVTALPKDLPEYIEVDVAQMHLNDVLHLQDLTPPTGIEFTALQQDSDHDLSLVRVAKYAGSTEPEGGDEIIEASTDTPTEE